MGITFPAYPEYPLPPLFSQWEAGPKGLQAPVYAWHAFTAPNTRVSGSVVTPRSLSDIPAGVLAIIWYASPPGYSERRTMDYGKSVGSTPYTFYLPDGTTRVNSTNMSQVAFDNLVTNLWSNLTYPE